MDPEMHLAFDRLYTHLDLFPMGMPKSPRAMDMLIKLFTKEEAELAVHLTPRPQTVDQLAVKTGIAAGELAGILAGMADKAIIFEVKMEGKPLYSLLPIYPSGIYNWQVKNMDEQLAHYWEEILHEVGESFAEVRSPTRRVVPAEQVISHLKGIPYEKVVPYQKASELVKEAKAITILDCICRKQKKLVGKGCDHPRDSICLYFGAVADFLNDKGIGKKATVAEALKVVERAENSGLVHYVANIEHNIPFMCNCCSCCCAGMSFLTTLARQDKPHWIARSEFHSTVDKELCIGCESCVPVCPVGATSMEDEKTVIKSTRCIGCGICAVECPTGAISLTRRERQEDIDVPMNGNEWAKWLEDYAREKGRTYFLPDLLGGH